MEYENISVADYVVARQANPVLATRLLFSWLCDDHAREILYQDMNRRCCALAFESQALLDNDASAVNDDGPKSYRQTAFLLAAQAHVEDAFTQSAVANNYSELKYSNSPFQGLGGTFMLAIDQPNPDPKAPDFKSHDAQRTYCYDALNDLEKFFDPIATVAFKMGALLPLKSRNFDLTALAEQVSIRYVAMLFGFSQVDLPILAETGRAIGKGLQYQMMARNFIDDPFVIPETKVALGKVSKRAAELLGLYSHRIGKVQEDAWTDLQEEWDKLRAYWFEDASGNAARKVQILRGDGNRPPFEPLMQKLANDTSGFSITEKAILMAGLVGGAVTNIRSAICISIAQYFKLSPEQLHSVRTDAVEAFLAHRDANWSGAASEKFRALVEEAMRVNPPAAFLPRKAKQSFLPAASAKDSCIEPKAEFRNQLMPEGSLMVLGVGGATWTDADTTVNFDKTEAANQAGCPHRFALPAKPSAPQEACPFSKVFGGPPDQNNVANKAVYSHSCFGKNFAMHIITYTVRQLMILPGLSQSIDDTTGKPKGLSKTWGYYCDSYPLEYQRDKLLRQSPLQTVLPVKNPVPENAAGLKMVLQYGVPFIEKVLKDARHVHFASFLFIDNDSKLVLFTAYDGDFDAYIGHFAREFGPLFDRFFSFIEGGPPAPIAKHPFEFVQFLRRYQQGPAAGYFFSAYPETRVDQIQYQFNGQRKYDLFELGNEP